MTEKEITNNEADNETVETVADGEMLNLEMLEKCVRLGADVVGIRRGVLTNGRVSRSLVAQAASIIHR